MVPGFRRPTSYCCNSSKVNEWIAGPGFAELAVRDGRLEEGLYFCDSLIARLEAEEMFRLTAELYYERSLIQNALGNSKAAELDLIGRADDAHVARAIDNLSAMAEMVKIIGTYPTRW